MERDAGDTDTPGRVLDHGKDIGTGSAGQAGREESRARIASASERRNCDQAAPVRRGTESIPAFFRISHTCTHRPASSPQILR